MKNVIRMVIAAILSAMSVPGEAQVGSNWLVGQLSDITVTTEGMLVRVQGNIQPSICSDPYGWMLIKNTSQILTSVVLSYWLANRKEATIYVTVGTGGRCELEQFDPTD